MFVSFLGNRLSLRWSQELTWWELRILANGLPQSRELGGAFERVLRATDDLLPDRALLADCLAALQDQTVVLEVHDAGDPRRVEAASKAHDVWDEIEHVALDERLPACAGVRSPRNQSVFFFRAPSRPSYEAHRTVWCFLEAMEQARTARSSTPIEGSEMRSPPEDPRLFTGSLGYYDDVLEPSQSLGRD